MRIIDWSSDVCSSDLLPDGCGQAPGTADGVTGLFFHGDLCAADAGIDAGGHGHGLCQDRPRARSASRAGDTAPCAATCLASGRDQESVVSGKSVSVSGGLGGDPIINKKNTKLT